MPANGSMDRAYTMHVPVAILLFAAAPAYHSAAAQQTSLQLDLAVARIAEPAKVAAVLSDLRLDSLAHWRVDLAALSLNEQAEMLTALEGGAVALGDRSRLRVWASSIHVGKKQSPPETYISDLSRRLQGDAEQKQAASEDKGVSSDTIAIILTGLTAVAGYVLQARLNLKNILKNA